MTKKKYKYFFNFEEWFPEITGKVFRIRVFRRVGDWTPYEMQNPSRSQSMYVEGDLFILCLIEKAILLPDGDVLLAIRYLDKDTREPEQYVEYNKLSNINLVQMDDDIQDMLYSKTDSINSVEVSPVTS